MPNYLKRLSFLIKTNGDLDLARGFRNIVLFLVPLGIGNWFNHLDWGMSVAVLANLLIFADVGSSYRSRTQVLLLSMLGAFIWFWIGKLSTPIIFLKVFVTFVCLFIGGYLSIYGQSGVMGGVVTSIGVLFGIYIAPEAIWQANGNLFFGLAAAWTLLLSVGMWPINPYQSLRDSVAQCYETVATYLKEAESNSPIDSGEMSRGIKLRESIEAARSTLTANRKGRIGYSPLGELGAILIERAEGLITSVISLRELVEGHHHFSQFITVELLVDNALEEIARIASNLAKLISTKKRIPIDLTGLAEIIKAIAQQKQLQGQVLRDHHDLYGQDYPGLVALSQLLAELEQLLPFLQETNSIVCQFALTPPRRIASDSFAVWEQFDWSWFDTLKANLTLDSLFFRHGLRMGITGALAITLDSFSALPGGFWTILTILVVLQPDIGKTFERFLHRVLGTILAVIMTPPLLAVISNFSILVAIAILAMSIAKTCLRFHYGLAAFFISVYAIILQTLEPGVQQWQIAWLRLIGTVLGASFAFLAIFVLFYSSERSSLSTYLAKAVDSCRRYFETVLNTYLGKTAWDPSVIAKERQQNLLDYSNAHASLTRLSAEPQTNKAQIEPALTLISYLHRFNRSVTVLMTQLHRLNGSQPLPEFLTFSQEVSYSLIQLCEALRHQTLPPPLPNLEQTLQQIQKELTRLQAIRLQEFRHHQEETLTRQLLTDYTILGTEFARIAKILPSMYSAINRCQFPR